MSLAVYRILTDQEKLLNIDLDNKQASFDALKKVEFVSMLMRNRHKIYTNRCCLWCGNDLDIKCNKTGKIKNFCTLYCNRRYSDFAIKLEGRNASRNIDHPTIKIFREYCLIRMIFRSPAMLLNNQLKQVCRRKELVSKIVA